jgi:hypothetical protein
MHGEKESQPCGAALTTAEEELGITTGSYR